MAVTVTVTVTVTVVEPERGIRLAPRSPLDIPDVLVRARPGIVLIRILKREHPLPPRSSELTNHHIIHVLQADPTGARSAVFQRRKRVLRHAVLALEDGGVDVVVPEEHVEEVPPL